MLEEHWKLEIDKVTEMFNASFGSLTESEFNYKPDPNVWSIAQNIAHLILLNNSYFQNFDETKKGNHVLPSIDAMDEFISYSLQTLRPYTMKDRPKTANTWDIWQPSRENFGLEILQDFTNHQSIFKMHIEELKPFSPHSTLIKYPGEATLVFRLEDCINFLIEHENRHWTQAQEVKQHLDEPVKNGR